MEIRVLKYFLAVAQEENMTKAAETLHTSQPNLSRQIAELEDSVGKKLFERRNRKVILTEEGMFLRKRAKEIIELAERTEADLISYNEEISGVVKIGAAETHAMRRLSDVMLSLRENHPQIQYDIFSGSTIEVTEQLNKGLLDFGVLVAPVDLSKYDYIKLPVNDIFGLIMRKDNPLSNKKSVTPQDLDEQPVLCARQQLDGNVLSSGLGYDVETLNIVSTFNLITTPAMMVEAGLGSAFTFDKLVDTEGSRNICFRPLEPKVETSLYLVWQKFQMFSPAAKKFLEQIRENIAEDI